jgi:predicted glycogen debranching enzyme
MTASTAYPSAIRFSRAICGDLGQAERREWWLANGLGAYGAGTIAGSLTRRYHGLLIAPVASPLGRRLLLAKADATLIDGEQSWPLFTNRWKSGVVAPAGHVRIASFHLDHSVPVWSYEIDDRQIEARIWMEPGSHTIYAAWRCDPASIHRRMRRLCELRCWPTIATITARHRSAASIRTSTRLAIGL